MSHEIFGDDSQTSKICCHVLTIQNGPFSCDCDGNYMFGFLIVTETKFYGESGMRSFSIYIPYTLYVGDLLICNVVLDDENGGDKT
jgi:hypothetical protein